MDSDMGPSYPQPPHPDISAGSDAISAGSGSSVVDSPNASHGGPKKRVLSNEEEEAKAQRKREQAAERQRRKREKDRMYGRPSGPSSNHFRIPGGFEGLVPDDHATNSGNTNGRAGMGGDEEDDRRERVRAAARERQRKHRALVKQRKSDGNSSYSPTPPPSSMFPPMGPHSAGSVPMPPPPSSSDQPQTEIPFPIPSAPVPGGQTFATTLLLSFSCAPLLKQHLLNTLNMSNEELASLEPVIADAWEWWNHQRQMHHELMANGGQPPPPLPQAPAQAPAAAAPASAPQPPEQPAGQASQPGFRVVAGPATTVTPPTEEASKT